MSRAIVAAIVIKLEADRKVSVPQLATYLAVEDQTVRAALLDMYVQGHCTLWTDAQGVIVGAEWKKQA